MLVRLETEQMNHGSDLRLIASVIGFSEHAGDPADEWTVEVELCDARYAVAPCRCGQVSIRAEYLNGNRASRKFVRG
jgi:hypothetical protein